MTGTDEIPTLYPGPFWAAYGALEGSRIDFAEVRAAIATDIVTRLIDAAEMTAGSSGGSIRLDNTVLPTIVYAVSEAHGPGLLIRPAVYAAARVLTALR